MKTFYITNRNLREVKQHKQKKGQSELIRFDWSAWAEDNGTLTTATWVLESGSASIAGESLTSNVGQAQITTAETGTSLIKVTATDGTDIDVQYLEVRAFEPQTDNLDYV